MRYHGTIIRPPSEARSYLLQVTFGCSNNSCTFCPTYLEKPFAVRPEAEVLEDIDLAARAIPDVRRVFLTDGNALVLSQAKLTTILRALRAAFPRLQRVGLYANAADILNKKDEELRELSELKVSILYMGLESGSDEVLRRVKKGSTSGEMVEAVRKAQRVGIKVSVMALLGLGGRELWKDHAAATGRAVTLMDPRYLSLLTLMVVPGTELHRQMEEGRFQLPGPMELLTEMKTILEHIQDLTGCIFRTNHASNYLPLAGTLMKEKGTLLETIDAALKNGGMYLRPESLRGL